MRGALAVSEVRRRRVRPHPGRRFASSWCVPVAAAIGVFLLAGALAGCDCGVHSSAGDAAPDAVEVAAPDSGADGEEAAERDADSTVPDLTEEDAVEAEDDGASDAPDVEVPASMFCGNGVLDPGEECDDGNRLDGDECDWRCLEGPGEEPVELPPDPEAGRAEVDLPPTEIDIGFAEPRTEWGYILSNRVPLLWTGEWYATVWIHHAGSDRTRMLETFVRFDRSGTRIDAPWTSELYVGPHAGREIVADLAWSGSEFGLLYIGTLAASDDPSRFRFLLLRLSADGKPIGPPTEVAPPSLDDDFWRLGLTWDGTAYAGVCDVCYAPPFAIDLAYLRIASDGSPIYPVPSTVSVGRGSGTQSISTSGSRHVVVWQGMEGSELDTVRLAVIDRDAGPLGGPIGLGPTIGPPDVVWTGGEFGVAWETVEAGTGEHVLYLARLSGAGELVAPPRLVVRQDDCPGVCFYGNGFTMAYGSRTFALAWAINRETYLLRIDRNGTLVERVRTEVDLEGYLMAVGLASDGEGFGLITAEYDPATTWPGPPLFMHYRVTP